MNLILSDASLATVDTTPELLGYDRSKVKIGIVHFGPGAFHRAHQAAYTDDLLRFQKGGDWGISAVSINSTDLRDALKSQDNLYTLSVLDNNPYQKIIGSILEVLVAPESPHAVIARLQNTDTKAVTLTITEKGYCLTPLGDLDFEHKGIQHDLKNPHEPVTAIGFIVAGLRERFESHSRPFTVISCDNLANNGDKLAKAVEKFAATIDIDFTKWVADHISFPNTMVDSITPATSNEVRDEVANMTGFRDEWPVQREAFTQWVIESNGISDLPPWDLVGATFTNNVEGYEKSKLRILNGLHSSLAFIGLLSGFETVDEAINDIHLNAFVQETLKQEILPTLSPVVGLNLKIYADQIIRRFENSAIKHYLSQIAWDSSQKIPIRILGTISDNFSSGKDSRGLCFVVAAWMRLMIKMAVEDSKITDPLADCIKSVVNLQVMCDVDRVNAFLQIEQIFPKHLVSNVGFNDAVTQAYSSLDGDEDQTRALVASLVGV